MLGNIKKTPRDGRMRQNQNFKIIFYKFFFIKYYYYGCQERYYRCSLHKDILPSNPIKKSFYIYVPHIAFVEKDVLQKH